MNTIDNKHIPDLTGKKEAPFKATSLKPDNLSPQLNVFLDGSGNNLVNILELLEAQYGPKFSGSSTSSRGIGSVASAFLGNVEKIDDGSSSNEEEDTEFDRSEDETAAANTISSMPLDTGSSETKNAAAASIPPGIKKKKRVIFEKYDASDPFIDDEEDVTEKLTHAAADGFFVFAGPLLQKSDSHKRRSDKHSSNSRKSSSKNSLDRKKPSSNTITTNISNSKKHKT